jgi:hypothetical protein
MHGSTTCSENAFSSQSVATLPPAAAIRSRIPARPKPEPVAAIGEFVATRALRTVSVREAAGRTQTLRFFDKPVSMKLTHADGTVDKDAPFPQPRPGDTLDVNSVDYVGTHIRHAARWTASTHLRCVFRAGPPSCESHAALGGSLLVFTGDPGTLTNGTGIYQGATGRVISNKEVGNDASDLVVRIQLRH